MRKHALDRIGHEFLVLIFEISSHLSIDSWNLIMNSITESIIMIEKKKKYR